MTRLVSGTLTYCCDMMEYHVNASFDKEGQIKYEDVDVVMNRWPNGTYGIPIHDGGTSLIAIRYCPWCGKQLATDSDTGERRIDVSTE